MLKLAQWFWRRFYRRCQSSFDIFQLSPLGKGFGPSFEKKKLNPLYPMMVLLKSCWNSSSLAKGFWSAPLLKITLGLLSYLKSGLFTSCDVNLIYIQWFWRSRFFNFLNAFLLFHHYLPLEKGVALHLTNFHQFHPRMLPAKFGWNWPVVLEKNFF